MTKREAENHDKWLQDTQKYWDDVAPAFDDEPDHGLHDPSILENWTALLKRWLPSAHATILDIGCGTGSLSVVLAGIGHHVTGIDLSPAMISLAQEKANRQCFPIEFHVMDAASPRLPQQHFDVILCRHLLWALPEPKQVLQRWSNLMKQKGRLILIEGYWETGRGLHAREVSTMLPSSLTMISIENLSDNSSLWGRNVTDERYAIIADKHQ